MQKITVIVMVKMSIEKAQNKSTLSMVLIRLCFCISVCPCLDNQTLASFINAQDVAHAVVEILDTYGRIVGNFHEEVNHYQPEPEPNEE